MGIQKKLTLLERKMFREAIIKEYKLMHEKPKNSKGFSDFMKLLRKITPLNIMLGIIASIFLIYLKGWPTFFQLVLTGVIWITIISTALAAISKK